MVSKDEVVQAMERLNNALAESHPNSETARYVRQALKDLTKSDGVAFTGTLQTFFNMAPSIKVSDNFAFSETERELWDKVFSFKQLGNNLWGAHLYTEPCHTADRLTRLWHL
ncbi:hypothetical protein [Lacticaseibacillus casei]|uniref:Uncharacterized protein n=2 Tax=Lacticaseibacillus casei TaxID=1582 RepID=A0AAD1ERW2_LACCA|nr:hypothetical protein [Lacticaseibacillus casei]BAN73235.1 hypothetical protein LBCZ_0067 [Lacticaseibacillus casei DSM 20011 = JCM 1134 = ATCC 393]